MCHLDTLRDFLGSLNRYTIGELLCSVLLGIKGEDRGRDEGRPGCLVSRRLSSYTFPAKSLQSVRRSSTHVGPTPTLVPVNTRDVNPPGVCKRGGPNKTVQI